MRPASLRERQAEVAELAAVQEATTKNAGRLLNQSIQEEFLL